MDALEFRKELKRMCKQNTDERGGCSNDCPVRYTNCTSISSIPELVPIVEKWSAEHQFVRNVDHVAELLEKAGYKADKEYMIECNCPPEMSEAFTHYSGSCGEKCSDCRKWWLEPYKGEENE